MAEDSPLVLCGLEEALVALKSAAAGAAQRARVHLSRGEYTDAERELRDALRIDPACSAAAGLLGWTLALTGRVAGADAEFQRAVRLEPRLPWPLVLRALAWRSWNRNESACRFLDRALELGAPAPVTALAGQWRKSLGLSGSEAPITDAKPQRRPRANSGPARRLRPPR